MSTSFVLFPAKLYAWSEYTIIDIHYFQNVLLDIIEMVMTVKCALDFQ